MATPRARRTPTVIYRATRRPTVPPPAVTRRAAAQSSPGTQLFTPSASHHEAPVRIGQALSRLWALRVPRSVTMGSHRGADVSPRRRHEISAPRRLLEAPSAPGRPARALVAPLTFSRPTKTLEAAGRRHRQMNTSLAFEAPSVRPCGADRDSAVTDDRLESVADQHLLLAQNRQPCAAYEYERRADHSTTRQHRRCNRR
jgi:hypothetical protein